MKKPFIPRKNQPQPTNKTDNKNFLVITKEPIIAPNGKSYNAFFGNCEIIDNCEINTEYKKAIKIGDDQFHLIINENNIQGVWKCKEKDCQGHNLYNLYKKG